MFQLAAVRPVGTLALEQRQLLEKTGLDGRYCRELFSQAGQRRDRLGLCCQQRGMRRRSAAVEKARHSVQETGDISAVDVQMGDKPDLGT